MFTYKEEHREALTQLQITTLDSQNELEYRAGYRICMERKATYLMTIDLSLMRKRLEAKQAELQKSIRGLTEAHPEPVGAIEASEGPQDSEEVAVDFLETQQEQSLLVNEQALLTEVQSALKRIENGTYGKCIDCGQPIPEKRLEAIPWAARCVKDEERLEERNLSITETYDEELD